MPTFLKIMESFTVSWLVEYLKVLMTKGYVYCVCIVEWLIQLMNTSLIWWGGRAESRNSTYRNVGK